MTELLDESSFDQAVAQGSLIVNVDTPTRVVRLHQAPAECTGLRDGFVTKVVENRGKTGSYWAVDSGTAARQRWGRRDLGVQALRMRTRHHLRRIGHTAFALLVLSESHLGLFR